MLLLARPRLFVVFSVVAVLGVVAVLNWPSSDLEGRLRDRLDLRGLGEDANTIMRLQMWQAGLRMIEDRPWIGFGDCDLREPSRPYYDQDENEPVLFGHLHSNPITLAVIWGIPGLVLVTAHFVLQLVLLWRAWRRARGDPDNVPPLARTWILGGIGVWAGFSVAGLTEWYFGDAESMLLYLGIIGVALRAGQAGLEGEPGPRPG
jgi:O-antigen ligase